jgi:hypothetical protein
MRAMIFDEFCERQTALVADARDAGVSIPDIVIVLAGMAKGLDPAVCRDLVNRPTAD